MGEKNSTPTKNTTRFSKSCTSTGMSDLNFEVSGCRWISIGVKICLVIWMLKQSVDLTLLHLRQNLWLACSVRFMALPRRSQSTLARFTQHLHDLPHLPLTYPLSAGGKTPPLKIPHSLWRGLALNTESRPIVNQVILHKDWHQWRRLVGSGAAAQKLTAAFGFLTENII